MSSFYEHFLIPILSQYRPTASTITDFIGRIINNGHVASNPVLTFEKVMKSESISHELHNPMTGETIVIQGCSRTVERQLQVPYVDGFTALAGQESEYNIAVATEGVPLHPPCNIGYVENSVWKPIDRPYRLEICCHVRSRPVRLYSMESEADLHRPPDFSRVRTRFDEDCATDERDGLFVHPEAGAFWVPNAGCGMFWIAFKFGKWLFPRLKDHNVNLLEKSVVDIATDTFGTEFVEAGNWG